jgi:predicted AAA+ superfamily ATPase
MFTQEQISQVIDAQKPVFLSKKSGVQRESLHDVQILNGFATIITGFSRCGKSTLLLQLMRERFPDALFLNFGDIRLAGLSQDDLALLHDEIEKRKVKILFFKEPQQVDGWEAFVNLLLLKDYQIFIISSNTSILKSEIDANLADRYVSRELFPFSFSEFLTLKNLPANADLLHEYLFAGGLPEYAEAGRSAVHADFVNDIVVKDITVRHPVRDLNLMRKLTVYLLSNIGNFVSISDLSRRIGNKTPGTMAEYFSNFTEARMIDFISQFSYSGYVQIYHPKKVYAIDTGIARSLNVSFSGNAEPLLENAVYLHLRRKYREIFYFRINSALCDFVVVQNETLKHLVQVCYELTPENREQEISGLTEAMKFFKTDIGLIVSFNQRDAFVHSGKQVNVVPAHEFLTQALETL